MIIGGEIASSMILVNHDCVSKVELLLLFSCIPLGFFVAFSGEGIDKYIPIYSKGIYKELFWVWKPGSIYQNLLHQPGCKHQFLSYRTDELHSQKSLVPASI